MSGFVKRNRAVNTVNPAGGINPALEPNVGQYGWTTSDSAHVNQLIAYVNAAKEAAEQSASNAEFISGKIEVVQKLTSSTLLALDRATLLAKDVEGMKNSVLVSHSDIVNKHKEITDMYSEMVVWKEDLVRQLRDLSDRVTVLENKP